MDKAALPKDFATPPNSSANSSSCFDCNICLDSARDPVVTLCGHLYCCLCINKWLMVEDHSFSGPHSCPVCKASLSQDSLVHLSGRGMPGKRRQRLVHYRPSAHHHHYDGSYGGEFLSQAHLRPRLTALTAGGMLGEMAVAAAMAGRLYYSRRYHQEEGATGGSPMPRRQEGEVERWLNQIWVFMLCLAVLCLLLF